MGTAEFWICEGCGRESPRLPGEIARHAYGRVTRYRPGPTLPVDWPCGHCGGELLLHEQRPVAFQWGAAHA